MEQIQTHWLRGFIWLSILAVLILMCSYWANDYSVSLSPGMVSQIMYNWEKNIPFLPWTIIPYWSLYGLCVVSLFLPMTMYAHRQHALRLISAAPIALICFYFYPTANSATLPLTHGLNIWQALYDRLMLFDKPVGQSPALHIILLVIVWRAYITQFGEIGRIFLNIGCFIIGLCALTTYQHHIIDTTAGFLIGVIICYVFPLSKQHRFQWQYPANIRLASRYLLPGMFLLTTAFFVNYWAALFILWVSLSTILVGLAYMGLGPIIFQKHRYGKFSYSARIIHAPYRFASRLVRKYFFESAPAPQRITDQLYLGAFGMHNHIDCNAVFDLCSEYEREGVYKKKYVSYPLIDQTVPTLDQLHVGAMKLDKLVKEHETVFVHCALGMSRSASLAIAWLLFSRQVKNMEDVNTFLKNNNIQSNLSDTHMQLLYSYSQQFV